MLELNQAVRYEAAVRFVAEVSGRTLLDVGSGSTGIAGWLPARWSVTAIDADFADYGPASRPAEDGARRIVGDARRLPFADRTFDVVLALDLLEHVAPWDRGTVLAELRRVTRRRLIVGCPAGAAAERADRRLADRYRAKGHEPPGWLAEHLTHGVPDPAELERALAGSGSLRVLGNENVGAHERLVRADSGALTRHAACAATLLLRSALRSERPLRRPAVRAVSALRGKDRPPTYRTFAVLDVGSSAGATR